MSAEPKPQSGLFPALDRPMFNSAFVREALDEVDGLPPEEGWWHIVHRDEMASLVEQLEAARQIIRDLIECPNQDAPMHTAGGCSYCSAWQVENAANWLRASTPTKEPS